MQARVAVTAAAALSAAAANVWADDPIPAFSGADGAAAYVTGGRGGIVYHVTKLDTSMNDNSPGTLRYGLDNNNFPANVPRTIVFDVGGTIHLGRTVSGWDGNGNGWDTQSRLNIPSNVTIAGQTAPSPIIIVGGVLKANGSNSIIRNITIAPGYGNRSFDEPGKPPQTNDFPDSYVYDAIDISGNNIMIDHVTAVYATDETISANELAYNITIQYSNISQGQNYPQADAEGSGVRYTGHGLGSLLQAGSNAKISVHHNLYAHQKGRLPRVGSEVGTGAYNDFRNNVFYNWFDTAGGGASGQPSFNNFINNVYIAGPGGDDVSQLPGEDGRLNTSDDIAVIITRTGGTGIFNGASSSATRVYHSSNIADLNKDGDLNDFVTLTNSSFSSSSIQASPYTQVPYYGVTDTAQQALERVLNYVGSRWWERDDVIDTIDERLIHETRTVTGKIMAWADDPFNSDPNEGVEWRAMVNSPTVTRPANWDTDQDGMPDHWELAHGLDPHTPNNNGDFDNDGYTDLEEYLNDIAAWPAPKPIVFSGATNNRYAQITNWDITWQPSRYDTAVINSGSVVVDAVGQHAGNLRLATSAGNNATLNITNGWLRVEETLVIAEAGTATLNLSGGMLRTSVLTMGAGNGTFNFTGGTLSADLVTFDLVNNGGIIAPGQSIGHTEVQGDLTLADGILQIEVNGLLSDTVGVTGTATLGGILEIIELDGFVPQVGDFWTILVADGQVLGSFVDVTDGYLVQTFGNSVVVQYVPEPAMLSPGALAALMLHRRRRRL